MNGSTLINLIQDAPCPRDGGICTIWIRSISQPKFESRCCQMLDIRVCGVRQNFYVFCLYLNCDLDVRSVDCLLTSMAVMPAQDLFACDLNGHHQEWLGTTTTNRHGFAAFEFLTVSGFD